MNTAVITTVHGRTDHLRNQLAGLAAGTRAADQHVIVAIEDPGVRSAIDTVPATGTSRTVVDLPAERGPLPVAAARNLGAATAIDDGAELLVFLDVDCIPGPRLVERYHEAASRPEHRPALLCGAVTYLPPAGPTGYPLDRLHELADPHPARPAPAPHLVLASADYSLFWSLSFAVTPATWRRIGGFCESYRGYGAEDTDFAQCAAAARVPMRWVGGADAYHQHHRVSDPPVEHLDDILRNAGIFRDRWGWWPMEGWLRAFEDLGLIGWDQGRPHRLSGV
jgi:GT2 family glycosyltransferase